MFGNEKEKGKRGVRDDILAKYSAGRTSAFFQDSSLCLEFVLTCF